MRTTSCYGARGIKRRRDEPWKLRKRHKYSVWRSNSSARRGIVFRCFLHCFCWVNLGMKGWGRTSDSPSCQPLWRQLLFFLCCYFFPSQHLLLLQVNELSGSTPTVPPLPPRDGSHCPSSGGGSHKPRWKPGQGGSLPVAWVAGAGCSPKQRVWTAGNYCRTWQHALASSQQSGRALSSPGFWEGGLASASELKLFIK